MVCDNFVTWLVIIRMTLILLFTHSLRLDVSVDHQHRESRVMAQLEVLEPWVCTLADACLSPCTGFALFKQRSTGRQSVSLKSRRLLCSKGVSSPIRDRRRSPLIPPTT